MSMQNFDKLSGYELWHRRLGHCTHRNIQASIDHSFGLEGLKMNSFDPHGKCPSCMAGKSHLEDMPKLKERATRPLARVNFDLFSSSVTSIEGHNHAAIFALHAFWTKAQGRSVRNWVLFSDTDR